MAYVIACDVGTTAVKTCLFLLEEKITLIASAQQGYGLYVLENGGVEQDADEWWAAMCSTTRALIEKSGVTPRQIEGLSFCSQMQGLVLVDKQGRAVRRPMSYMDQRARAEFKAGMAHGLTVSGVNVVKLLKSLKRTCAVSTSVKDPV